MRVDKERGMGFSVKLELDLEKTFSMLLIAKWPSAYELKVECSCSYL